MRKGIFLSLIVCLWLPTCIPQAMAQKQSRVEKLLGYLNNNDLDKWQKSREKLDDETKVYYAEELALMDDLNELWNKQNEQAAPRYFRLYETAASANLSSICEGEKIELSAIRNRANQSIISLLESSPNKVSFSRLLIDSMRVAKYPMDSTQMVKLRNIREMALMDEMLKSPSPLIYRTYLTEYPDGKFISRLYSAENMRLFQIVKKSPNNESFKAFFEDTDMMKFYKDPVNRPYLAEVRTIYDDFLFHQIDSIKKDGSASAIRKFIDEYKKVHPKLAVMLCA